MISLQVQIGEVKREISLRKRVYPAFVLREQMTQREADQHLLRLEAVLVTLEGLALAEQPSLFPEEKTP